MSWFGKNELFERLARERYERDPQLATLGFINETPESIHKTLMWIASLLVLIVLRMFLGNMTLWDWLKS